MKHKITFFLLNTFLLMSVHAQDFLDPDENPVFNLPGDSIFDTYMVICTFHDLTYETHQDVPFSQLNHTICSFNVPQSIHDLVIETHPRNVPHDPDCFGRHDL